MHFLKTIFSAFMFNVLRVQELFVLHQYSLTSLLVLRRVYASRRRGKNCTHNIQYYIVRIKKLVDLEGHVEHYVYNIGLMRPFDGWMLVDNKIRIFSSPEHKVLRVSYCDRPLSVVRRRPSSVVRRPSSVNFFTETSSPLKPLIWFWPKNFTGMIPGWSPTKVVQKVLIGCISRSRGQKVGFQNAIFKNLLVWNYKA